MVFGSTVLVLSWCPQLSTARLPCHQGSGDQSFLNSNSTADLKDHISLDFKYLHNQSQILSVGDILLTINGVNVLDLPHTQVVRVAQKCKFYNHMDGLMMEITHIMC